MNTIRGQCRLCLAENAELQDSHILPKWAYKRIRGSNHSKTPKDPVFVSGGSATITSKQITEYLLCWDCEQLFAKDEKVVSELVYQEDGSVPLLDRLHLPDPPMHPAILEPRGIDLGAVSRCVLSIFWRAHISRDGMLPSLAPYEQSLRSHLLCGAPLPASVALVLILQVGHLEGVASVGQVIAMPKQGERGEDLFYSFALCGLLPFLIVGPARTPARQLSVLHCAAKRILVRPAEETSFNDFFGQSVRAAIPRGKAMRALMSAARGGVPMPPHK